MNWINIYKYKKNSNDEKNIQKKFFTKKKRVKDTNGANLDVKNLNGLGTDLMGLCYSNNIVRQKISGNDTSSHRVKMVDIDTKIEYPLMFSTTLQKPIHPKNSKIIEEKEDPFEILERKKNNSKHPKDVEAIMTIDDLKKQSMKDLLPSSSHSESGNNYLFNNQTGNYFLNERAKVKSHCFGEHNSPFVGQKNETKMKGTIDMYKSDDMPLYNENNDTYKDYKVIKPSTSKTTSNDVAVPIPFIYDNDKLKFNNFETLDDDWKFKPHKANESKSVNHQGRTKFMSLFSNNKMDFVFEGDNFQNKKKNTRKYNTGNLDRRSSSYACCSKSGVENGSDSYEEVSDSTSEDEYETAKIAFEKTHGICTNTKITPGGTIYKKEKAFVNSKIEAYPKFKAGFDKPYKRPYDKKENSKHTNAYKSNYKENVNVMDEEWIPCSYKDNF